MGMQVTYTCPRCGYSACVEGGVGAGMRSLSITCICDNCHILQDVFYMDVGDLRERIAQLETGGGMSGESPEKPVLSFRSRCEKCHRKRHLRIWDEDKRPCPVCGEKMEKDEFGVVVMWD